MEIHIIATDALADLVNTGASSNVTEREREEMKDHCQSERRRGTYGKGS